MNEGIPTRGSHEREVAPNPENIVYKRPSLKREQGPEVVEKLASDFKDYYRSLGYTEKEPVPISSGADPSVRFIGSHISVFKPELLDGSVPTPGEFIVQDCVRTQNAKKIFDDTYLPRWGSSFTSLGTIAPADRLNDVSREATGFLTKSLAVAPEDIALRVYSRDTDLVSAVEEAFPGSTIETDSQPDKYYRHQIGVEGVWGRNFNLALRNANGKGFSDVGNIILIENVEEKLGVELALGATTILKQVYNADHVSDFYPINGLEDIDPTIGRKLEDAIITSSILLREGLMPNASDNRGRILRKYMRAVLYLGERSGISEKDIRSIAAQFERRQFGAETPESTTKLFDYIQQYRSELMAQGGAKTSEDKVILSVLRY